ncbi:hypothetical protein CC80DRAFT_172904 [Byssothecium circinans]|uniref:Uncharacterized protein n=1 Tax=Byssothecium circinans TaxID=147558 RepID=A0A6A5TKJ1_9PLEO|nr:hypothetical protein CC80DRAFT_172904 [Byssothecium circinans]
MGGNKKAKKLARELDGRDTLNLDCTIRRALTEQEPEVTRSESPQPGSSSGHDDSLPSSPTDGHRPEATVTNPFRAHAASPTSLKRRASITVIESDSSEDAPQSKKSRSSLGDVQDNLRTDETSTNTNGTTGKDEETRTDDVTYNDGVDRLTGLAEELRAQISEFVRIGKDGLEDVKSLNLVDKRWNGTCFPQLYRHIHFVFNQRVRPNPSTAFKKQMHCWTEDLTFSFYRNPYAQSWSLQIIEALQPAKCKQIRYSDSAFMTPKNYNRLVSLFRNKPNLCKVTLPSKDLWRATASDRDIISTAPFKATLTVRESLATHPKLLEATVNSCEFRGSSLETLYDIFPGKKERRLDLTSLWIEGEETQRYAAPTSEREPFPTDIRPEELSRFTQFIGFRNHPPLLTRIELHTISFSTIPLMDVGFFDVKTLQELILVNASDMEVLFEYILATPSDVRLTKFRWEHHGQLYMRQEQVHLKTFVTNLSTLEELHIEHLHTPRGFDMPQRNFDMSNLLFKTGPTLLSFTLQFDRDLLEREIKHIA